MENGNWTKFEAFRIDPTPEIPHGIRYSLTFHDRNNRRVLGFDNAHAFKPRKKSYGAREITWDHGSSLQSLAQVLISENRELLRIIEEQNPTLLKEVYIGR